MFRPNAMTVIGSAWQALQRWRDYKIPAKHLHEDCLVFSKWTKLNITEPMKLHIVVLPLTAENRREAEKLLGKDYDFTIVPAATKDQKANFQIRSSAAYSALKDKGNMLSGLFEAKFKATAESEHNKSNVVMMYRAAA